MININKKNITIIICIIILLMILLNVAGNNKDIININLKTNNKKIFSVDDLKINDLKFGSTEKEIEKSLGKPEKIQDKKINSFQYKIYKYKNLKLTLKEFYSDYMLVGAEITSRKYKTSRNIKVGNNITKVINSYNIKNKTGNYLYGNYKLSSLSRNSTTDNIYLGIRTKKQVIYINRDAVTDNPYTNKAQIIYNYKNGKITKIQWSYDFN